MHGFSLSTTLFASATLNWVGPLLLSQAEVHRIPVNISGVYLLHQFAPSLGAYPMFYAGQSIDLRRRLLEHVSDTKAKPAIWVMRTGVQAYFSAAPAPTALLDRIEAGLIRGLKPAVQRLDSHRQAAPRHAATTQNSFLVIGREQN